MIREGSLALLALGLPGCATRRPTAARAVPMARPPVRLPHVRVSWDRIIRATVGLRPHRPSGFVLRAEKLDAKTLVHNFGHGGAGMSLSWGTGQLAAEMALQQADRRAAVIGCGVVGLTSARQLQRRGFDVTIYAEKVPPDTTSNMSLAGFTPTSGLVANESRTPQWDAQFREAVTIAYRQLQLLAGPKYGISWIYNYSPTDELPEPRPAQGVNQLLPDSARTGSVVLEPGQHPFPTKYAIEGEQMRIEPSIYLDALVQDVLASGGRIKIRKFETARDLMALEENVIVNCTGLGAKALFGDPELIPLKGQLIVMVPQDDVKYSTNGALPSANTAPGVFVHMMPRHDGIVLGGTSQRGVWTTEIDEAERKRVVDAHVQLFAAMK
jgi:glycine/D-amino acid oxidase-like deaminating enzyme